MRKQLKKAIAITLTVAMLLSSTLTSVWIGAADSDAYQAQLLDISYVSEKNGAPYELTLDPGSTALTPEIPSAALTIDWSGALNEKNADDYLFVSRTETAANSDVATLEEAPTELYEWPDQHGLMFYAKTPVSSPESSLHIKFAVAKSVGATTYMGVTPNKDVYYLQKGTEEWEANKTGVSYSAATSTTIGGSIPLPAGFEGWIRIPYSSIYQKGELDRYVRRIDMYLEKAGGDYTVGGGVQIGAFMWVDNDTDELTKVSISGGEAKTLLVEFKHHKGHLLDTSVSPVGNVTVEKTENETAFALGYTYEIAAESDTANTGFSMNTESDYLATMTADGSLIFYAGMRLAAGNKLGVSAGGKSLTAGATVYTKNIGDPIWQPATVGDDGMLALPAAFEGYVMAPATAFGITEARQLKTVVFTFDSVTASAEHVRIGSILISDTADTNLYHVRLDVDTRYVFLNKGAYYHTHLLPNGTVTTTPVDQNYFGVSDKNTGAEIVPGLDVGYDYEMSVGSAELGTHKNPHAVVGEAVESYTATLVTLGSVGNGGHSTVTKVTDADDALTPTVPSDWAKWLWTAESVVAHMDNSVSTGKNAQNAIAISNNLVLSPDKALLMYVKLPAGAPELPLGFRFSTPTHYDLTVGSAAYLLPADGTAWTEVTTTSVTGRIALGYVPLPAEFEGWVRIPFESIATNGAASLDVKNVRTYLGNVTDAYTNADDQYSVGGLAVVNHASKNLYKLNTEDETITDAVLGAEPEVNAGYNATLVTLGSVGNGGHSTVTKVTDADDALTPTVPSDWAKWLWTAESVVAHMDNSVSTGKNAQNAIAISNNLVLSPDKALLMYVKLPAGAPELPLGFRFSTPTHYDLNVGAAAYLLPADASSWTQVETTSVTGRIALGYVPLPAEFEGWVRIPFESIATNGAASLDVKNVRTYLGNVTDAYTNADDQYSVGGLAVVDQATKNLTTLTTTDGTIQEALLGAEPAVGYTATLATLGSVGNGGHSTVTKVTDADTALTPTVPSDWVKWLWTAESVVAHMDNTQSSGRNAQNAIAISNNLVLSPDKALLMYVKLPAGAPELPLGFRFSTPTHYDLNVGAAAYLLPADSNVWTQVETTSVTGRIALGYVPLPAEFEGWVRIPFESIATDGAASLDVKNVRTYLGNVTDAYTNADDQYSVGALMVVDRATKNLHTVTTTDGTIQDALLALAPDPEDVDDSAINFTTVMDAVNGEKFMTTDALPNDIYLSIPLTQTESVDLDDALMFYVRQTGRISSRIRVDMGKDLTVATGAVYRFYDSKTGMWNDGAAGAGGVITLKPGMEGWIRIPATGFADGNGVLITQAAEFNEIRVQAFELGGPYGTVRIGTFLTTDYGDKNLTTMRVDIAKEQGLALLRGYSGTTPSVQVVNPALDTTAERVPFATMKDGYIYELSADTEKTLDADMGFEMIFVGSSGVLEAGKGVLAYVKVPGKANALAFGGDQALMSGKEWYMLGKDAAWQKKTATDTGAMELPAGFEGYVLVPSSSMKELNATVSTFMFAFNHVGGSYGSPWFGSVSFVDNADYLFTTYYNQALEYPQSLELSDRLNGYVLNGTVEENSDTDNRLTATMLSGNPLTPDVNNGYAFEFAPEGDAYALLDTVTTPHVKFTLDALSRTELSGSQSLMFYVKTTAANILWVQANAENAAAMKLGNAYYTLAKGDAYWQIGTADRNGHIVFEEGFEGWVRIPYTELLTKLNLQGTLLDLRFAFRYVGGAYGNPQIGTIMITENNANCGALKLFGSDTPVNLFGSKQKTEPARDDVAYWESVTIPYVGMDIGSAYPLSTTLATDDEVQASITFGNKITESMTPFKAPGITFSADTTIAFADDDTPRHIASMGVSIDDGVGLVLYVKMPKRPENEQAATDEVQDQYADTVVEEVTNNLWVQINTAKGHTLSLRHVALVKTLQKGDTVWLNQFVDNRRIELANGFEGYVYLPFEALTTSNNSTTKNHFSLERDNAITKLNIGFGEYGGELGDAYLGGMFIAKNDALSHNGAYVDGSSVCRDVFTGEAVDAEAIKQTPYDAPIPGEVYLEVPEATNPDKYYVLIEDKKISSVKPAWDAVPDATQYRVDVYKSFALTTSFNAGMGYQHMYSIWTTTPYAVCENLIMNNHYLIQVFAFNGDTGIEVFPATSAIPEGTLINDVKSDDEDSYKYPWDTDEDELPEGDTTIGNEGELTDPDQQPEDDSVIVEEVIRVKKPKKGLKTWHWILIGVGGVVVVGVATLFTLLLIKRKKKGGKVFVTNDVKEGGEQE